MQILLFVPNNYGVPESSVEYVLYYSYACARHLILVYALRQQWHDASVCFVEFTCVAHCADDIQLAKPFCIQSMHTRRLYLFALNIHTESPERAPTSSGAGSPLRFD